MLLTMIGTLFSELLGAELERETASAMSSLHLSLIESNETKEWITSALKLAGSEGTLLLPNWRS